MAGKATCPECCGDCIIVSDLFDREDSDDPGAYTEVGGSDYDVSNEELLCVTGGLLLATTSHPDGDQSPQRVKRKFMVQSDSQYARVVLGYTDEDNYCYATVEAIGGCWVLRLTNVSGGTHTDLNDDPQTIGDGVEHNVWHWLEACLDSSLYAYPVGDLFRAKVTLFGGKVYGVRARDGSDLADGDQGGIDDSDGVRCDNFSYEWMGGEEGSEHERCPECITPCLIETDEFPGGSETACKWDGGKMRVFHPELGVKHYATATFLLSSGQNAEVRVNMTSDESSYHWAKLALSGSTVTLTIGKDGTTLETKTSVLGAPGTYTISICFSGNMLTGAGGPLSAAKPSTEVADGIYAGRAGTATFSYFEFQKHISADDPNCPDCDEFEPTANCIVCCNDLPFYLAVEIDAALTNFSNACDGCDSIGGTYITINQSNNVFNPQPCLWIEDFTVCSNANGVGGDGWCFNNDPFGTWSGGGGMRVAILLLKNGATGKCLWRVTFRVGLAAVNTACFNPDEVSACDCVAGCIAPCLDGTNSVAYGFVTYESPEFDVGQCPSFPVTLNKIGEASVFPCKGDWPNTISIDQA